MDYRKQKPKEIQELLSHNHISTRYVVMIEVEMMGTIIMIVDSIRLEQ